MFDSPLGLAIRRWCAPCSTSNRDVAPEEYVARRTALGEAEVTRRMLRRNGVEHYLVETGYAEGVLGPAEMAAAANADASEIVRLESVFETLAAEVGAAAAVRDRSPRCSPSARRPRRASRASSPTASGSTSRPSRPTHAEAVAAAGPMLALAGPRAPAWPTRPCCATCSGAVSSAGCRCSCTPATATPTSTCTAATRCCSPASSGWSSRAASTCCCCTATRTTARRATSRRCSRTSTSTSASR